MRSYKALYYGFGCTLALRWKRYLPGNYFCQVVFAKSNGNCLAYHEIPKNGSTTVKSLLLDATGHPVPASAHGVHLAFHPFGYKHWHKLAPSEIYLANTSIQIVNNSPSSRIPPGFDHAFHFAFVRNPWARLVSCYANKVLALLPRRFADFRRHYPLIRFERMTFTDFVRFVCRVPDDLCDRHFAPQCCYLDGITLDFIGRVERFVADLTEVIRLAGLDERLLKWAHTKTTTSTLPLRGDQLRSVLSQHYTDYYTTQTRNLVARKYARDIDRFGYRFGD